MSRKVRSLGGMIHGEYRHMALLPILVIERPLIALYFAINWYITARSARPLFSEAALDALAEALSNWTEVLELPRLRAYAVRESESRTCWRLHPEPASKPMLLISRKLRSLKYFENDFSWCYGGTL